jgi:lysophospholipase L1-like esterase
VAVSNLGVSGSQLVHFARTDDAVLAEELRAYKPDLIVLAFGTNEGFSPVFRPSEYEVLLRTQIGRLRRLSGGTPILLIGAPDASSRRAVMLHNAPGPTPPACPEPVVTVAPPPAPVPPPPESRSPIDEVMADLRGSEGDIAEPPPPPAAAPSAAPVRWTVRASEPLFPPAGLASVRDVQRRVAASLGVAFWDWNARMGGACSAVRWVKADPPLMRGDYVHVTQAGGQLLGARLLGDLDKAATIESRR